MGHHTCMREDCQLLLRKPGVYEGLVGGGATGSVSARRGLKDAMKQPSSMGRGSFFRQQFISHRRDAFL